MLPPKFLQKILALFLSCDNMVPTYRTCLHVRTLRLLQNRKKFSSLFWGSYFIYDPNKTGIRYFRKQNNYIQNVEVKEV